jgi:hypothetical protein
MLHQYLIFPCFLAEHQFQILREEKTVLEKYLVLKPAEDNVKLRSILHHIGIVIFSINDLLANPNISGYRFNSYELNKISLTLSYVYEMIRKYDPDGSILSAAELAHSHYRIDCILASTFQEYTEGMS